MGTGHDSGVDAPVSKRVRPAGARAFACVRGPIVRPILLHNLHQDDVELAHEELLLPIVLFIARARDDEVDDERLDARTLLCRERLPSELDRVLKDLQRVEFRVGREARRLKNRIHTKPVQRARGLFARDALLQLRQYPLRCLNLQRA